MLTCARLPENSDSFDETRPLGRKYGKIGEAESSFLLGEAIFKIVCSRFAWSTVLKSRINGQELITIFASQCGSKSVDITNGGVINMRQHRRI